MIQREFYETRSDGINLWRTYSDQNYKIRQIETSAIYDEAIDIEGAPYTYEETNLIIEQNESQDDSEENERIARDLLGIIVGSENE